MATKSYDGSILHFAGTRLRVTGSGNLKLSLNSLQNVNVATLTPIPMADPTSREPVVLANFINQRGQLKFGTTVINEVFNISRIVIFVKPIWTGYPQ